MSRLRTVGRSDHPIKFKNNSGETIPAFAVLKLDTAAVVGKHVTPNADKVAADGEDALYVNSANPVPDGEQGNCRSVYDGMFWVRYDGTPTAGEVWGIEADSWEAVTDGTQFKVHYVKSSHTIMLCSMLMSGGGGDCDCVTVHEVYIAGIASGGTYSLDVDVIDSVGGTTSDTLSGLAYNGTAADLQTAYEGHSGIAVGDVEVKGGNHPNVALYVIFKSTGDLNRYQPLPQPSSSLTGTNPIVKIAMVTNKDWEA